MDSPLVMWQTQFSHNCPFQDGETHLKFELHPLNEAEDATDDPPKVTQALDKPPPVVLDDSPVRAFLNGENCLNGVS